MVLFVWRHPYTPRLLEMKKKGPDRTISHLSFSSMSYRLSYRGAAGTFFSSSVSVIVASLFDCCCFCFCPGVLGVVFFRFTLSFFFFVVDFLLWILQYGQWDYMSDARDERERGWRMRHEALSWRRCLNGIFEGAMEDVFLLVMMFVLVDVPG
ncbi:hypothetical protein G7K_4633-t1 [Saitoella complicata NRRL Y-17804]|uniref:Transmembrane protein n=1 Tax=Saitoella complicata (strain BCRC 22490 / CBS 7301 / JCM 7358 / NBRC 10748 / NRRL Y-17804) TaxID=698492 RepID=A0A0E9NKZ2_SAICN|nr:hypothetical protein G7K_4633-t1 [Saitoella complicata NRRL Y-17804]